MLKLIVIVYLLFFLNPAYSYLGPGMGAGIIFATLGFIVALVAGVFGILWFPIKRLINRKKQEKKNIKQ